MPEDNAKTVGDGAPPTSDKMVSEPATITVRPSKAIRPKLRRLSALNGRSEGQIILESLEAIVEMIDGGSDFVPHVVQRSRLLLAHLGRSDSSRGKLGGGAPTEWEHRTILPSETVQNLSPRLTLLPVVHHFPFIYSLPEQIKAQADELVAVPVDKIKGATFAYKPSGAHRETIDGTLPPLGEIFLLSFPEEMAKGTQQYETYWNQSGLSALARYNQELVSGPVAIHKGKPIIGSWPANIDKRYDIPVANCKPVAIFHGAVSPQRILEEAGLDQITA